MSEAQAVEPVVKQFGVTTVTNDNLKQYVDEKLGVPPPPTPEQVAANEVQAEETRKAAEVEEQKKSEDDPTHDVPEVPKDKKGKINERFSVITAKRKEAEAKAQAEAERAARFEQEARTLREEREQLAKQAAELKAKYEPVKIVQEEKPKPTDFTDINEYTQALEDWAKADTLKAYAKAEAEKRAQEQFANAQKSWAERREQAAKEIPDFSETIASAKDVKVTDIIRDAIFDSELGPQLLYHLAKNPDVVNTLNELPPARALKELGKLEDRISSPKQETKEVKEEPKAKISKAPAPINPISGGSSIGTRMMDENGNFTGTYDDWKRMRAEGKI